MDKEWIQATYPNHVTIKFGTVFDTISKRIQTLGTKKITRPHPPSPLIYVLLFPLPVEETRIMDFGKSHFIRH